VRAGAGDRGLRDFGRLARVASEMSADDLSAPNFDAVICADVDGDYRDVVVHRNATDTVAFHSPLVNGSIHCDICEKPGTKVWLEGCTHD
jgi:hypothetical protein